MVILGLDPGLAIVGFGVVETDGYDVTPVNYGIVETTPDMTLPRRLSVIYQDVQTIIRQYRPDAIALEELFFYHNITTGVDVAQARGVALIAAANAMTDEQLFEYTPMQIKLAVCGYGNADKHQVQEMVRTILKLDKIPRPDDAADALAAAICHAQSLQFASQYTIR